MTKLYSIVVNVNWKHSPNAQFVVAERIFNKNIADIMCNALNEKKTSENDHFTVEENFI